MAERAALGIVQWIQPEDLHRSIVNCLFGLLCWRAIFALAGAFFLDFHHGPADLSSRQFCRRRAREFAECSAQKVSNHPLLVSETLLVGVSCGIHYGLRVCGRILLCAAAACAGGCVPGRAVVLPDSFVARVEVFALIQTLNADLLSHDSATLTLERWCDVHRLASPPRIVAERVADVDKPPTPDQRLELAVSATELVRYRRVRLRCGGVVLSEADNWYVPSRLTAQMNAMLEATDMPFGRVVRTLHFRRHTLSAILLWSPLPEGWEMNPTAPGECAPRDCAPQLRVPEKVLEHRALLVLPDGTPVSEVVETYTGNVLAFPLPTPK